jgi:hypothetical protein
MARCLHMSVYAPLQFNAQYVHSHTHTPHHANHTCNTHTHTHTHTHINHTHTPIPMPTLTPFSTTRTLKLKVQEHCVLHCMRLRFCGGVRVPVGHRPQGDVGLALLAWLHLMAVRGGAGGLLGDPGAQQATRVLDDFALGVPLPCCLLDVLGCCVRATACMRMVSMSSMHVGCVWAALAVPSPDV